MNVTLTFNVFFGPLAVAALVGCGPMKHYDFNQIDKKIDLEQRKLFKLELTLSEIDAEKSRLVEFLNYANSPSGRQYYLNAQCKSALPAAIPYTITPTEKCEARVRTTEQGGECAIKVRDGTQLNGSVTLEEALTGIVCFTAPATLPKWLRFPSPAKVAIRGATILTRSVTCASTYSNMKQRVAYANNHNDGHNGDCEAEFLRCKTNEIAHRNQIALESKISRIEFQRCESITNRFPGLSRRHAQNRIYALDSRAIEVGSDIQHAQTAIHDAQALKITAKFKNSGSG
ncbi:hypothetical protein AB833_05060 [Chromatiales bacterium (ex Bugula neritina AB1)]|nr:hypothetical protein AB833_05060 [Chromatiales bacterium (ex Bugula neritina AB1)]